MASIEENKEVVQKYLIELINNGDFSAIDKYIDPDFTTPHGVFKGAESLKQFSISLRNAFPDLHLEINEMVAEGDIVSVILTSEGTFTNQWNGIEPTGKHFVLTEADFYRIKEGKICFNTSIADLHSMSEQIGIPLPTQQ